MTDRTWFRPESESDARKLMIDCESKRDYEGAALAAITIADYIAVRTAEGAAAYERQALVYASLHQAQTGEWIAENRR